MKYMWYWSKMFLFGLLFPVCSLGQDLSLLPNTPTAHTLQQFGQTTFTKPEKNISPSPDVIQYSQASSQEQQNAAIISEVDANVSDKNFNDVRNDIEDVRKYGNIKYNLPSFSDKAGSSYYYLAFENIVQMDSTFSMKDVNFRIENAYFDNRLDQKVFDKSVIEAANFIRLKMKEEHYSENSNTAKNFMLFQFFAETLTLKATKEKHQPFKYDFEDYMGMKDYARVFVSKLMATGSGQCHSLPLLYLILADEIGAKAYLALSPNHSYIRFPDDHGKWFNIELTNGMFSTPSYILQSGYIKAEALQHKIYMENLTKKELLAQMLSDLANGYVHKYGYDEFVKKVIDKALSLYPNSINAHMLKANLDTARFEYVMKQLGINARDGNELQKIARYPKAVALLNEVNREYDLIDNLGFEFMPEEAYQKWLEDMKVEEQIQENQKISNQLKKLTITRKILKD